MACRLLSANNPTMQCVPLNKCSDHCKFVSLCLCSCQQWHKMLQIHTYCAQNAISTACGKYVIYSLPLCLTWGWKKFGDDPVRSVSYLSYIYISKIVTVFLTIAKLNWVVQHGQNTFRAVQSLNCQTRECGCECVCLSFDSITYCAVLALGGPLGCQTRATLGRISGMDGWLMYNKQCNLWNPPCSLIQLLGDRCKTHSRFSFLPTVTEVHMSEKNTFPTPSPLFSQLSPHSHFSSSPSSYEFASGCPTDR